MAIVATVNAEFFNITIDVSGKEVTVDINSCAAHDDFNKLHVNLQGAGIPGIIGPDVSLNVGEVLKETLEKACQAEANSRCRKYHPKG